VRVGLEVGDTAILRFDTCVSSIGVSVLLSPAAEPIKNAYHQIRNRGSQDEVDYRLYERQPSALQTD
jgi:hypothetical protein